MFISVIIPMYNSKDTIIKCIDSIIKNNKNADFEIIIVNDGSTDASAKIVLDYIKHKKISNINLYNKSNGGVSSARNFGINKSRGKYIWFVDSDDEIVSNAIELLKIETKDEDIVKFNYIIERISGKLFLKGKKVLKNISKNFLFNYTLNSPCTQLYKSDFIKNNKLIFSEKISYGEDFLFNLNAYSKTDNIKLTNKYLYIYKKSSNSITRNKSFEIINKRIHDVLESYGKLYDYKDYFSFSDKHINKRVYRELLAVITSVESKENVLKLISLNEKLLNYNNINKKKLFISFKRREIFNKIKRKIKELLK